MSSSQYSASTLDVNGSYMGQPFACEITNVLWNGNGGSFNGQIDGVPVTGTDNNGTVTATGGYQGINYTASGVVTGWN